MFDIDTIHKRGQALEDQFFHRVDARLRAELRESMERDKAKSELAGATGFADQELLDHLLDAGFKAETIAALALVPPVFVAWANGSIEAQERQTIMSAALHRGMEQNQTAFHLIEAWLHERPPRSLWGLWKDYVDAIHKSLAPTFAEMLKKEILRLSNAVAESAAGMYGADKVSIQEQKVLAEITSACES